MPDLIHIRDLQLRTVIGITAEERRDRQDVLINIALETDTRPAGRSDDIADAVNYRSLTKQVIALVESTQFCLVEKLAEDVAALCLRAERVQRVQVSVEKPGALRFARSVGVSIERERSEA